MANLIIAGHEAEIQTAHGFPVSLPGWMNIREIDALVAKMRQHLTADKRVHRLNAAEAVIRAIGVVNLGEHAEKLRAVLRRQRSQILHPVLREKASDSESFPSDDREVGHRHVPIGVIPVFGRPYDLAFMHRHEHPNARVFERLLPQIEGQHLLGRKNLRHQLMKSREQRVRNGVDSCKVHQHCHLSL
ncbi:hypothetical protein D3C71_1489670 [compost metagenome]